MKIQPRKLVSILLACIMLLSCGVICASANTGVYYEPQPYQPSAAATEVGFYRYFFLLPDDWCNEYTDAAGIYWWSGADACGALDGTGRNVEWPGYKMYKYGDTTANVWYCDVPKDVPIIFFNNALHGGDETWDNFDSDRFAKAYQTIDIGIKCYDPGESENYPEGTENFNNMIYIVDPEKAYGAQTGHAAYGGEWYYYHGDGKWDTQLDPVYGGAEGEAPHASDDNDGPAKTEEYFIPQPYQPSAAATEVGFYRYFFLLPNDWSNEYTDAAGIYWWSGADACGALDGTGGNVKWPGYMMYKYGDTTANVWYCDVPMDVPTIIFNNALDGGDVSWDSFNEDRYLKAYQTVDINTEYYDSGESENYPEGTENFNNMIYVIDPEKVDVSVTGHKIYGGEWYYYHGDGLYDTQLDPVYGGAEGEAPHASDDYDGPAIPDVPGQAADPGFYFNYGVCSDGTAVINGYVGGATDLEIPSEIGGYPVTSIGEYAFYDCSSLESVTIPDSVTEIGSSAFQNCTSLTSVTIPDSVAVIGDFTFAWCAKLADITIPDSVIFVGESAFCDTEWYYNQPDGMIYAGKAAYEYKGEMPENTKITLIDGTASISGYAFSWCDNLTGISIPDGVVSIGESAFWNCNNLTDISIPGSVLSIGSYAFDDCEGIESLTLSEGVTSIGECAFEDCDGLKSVTIPASVSEIGEYAFGYYHYYDIENDNEDYYGEEIKYDGFTIYGYKGTAAESYATENGFEFIALEEPPQSGTITFIKPDEWKNVKAMYCHIWMCNDDGTVNWPRWKTNAEEMDDNGDGSWSYDLSKLENGVASIDPDKGAAYAVVFVSDTGIQTYNLIFDAECIGDTAYVTGNIFENPEDSNKSAIEAAWKNSVLGAEKKITSSCTVVGNTLPEGFTDAKLMAVWLKSYCGDTSKTDNTVSLLNELGVSGNEVYSELEKITVNMDANEREALLEQSKELLSVQKLLGDVNGDGKYDIRDAAAIQLYKARLYIGEFDESVADVNGDGVIDVRDAAYIQLDLAKLL